MNQDDPNTDKSHNTRSTAWREIIVIYGLLAAALAWNWLA